MNEYPKISAGVYDALNENQKTFLEIIQQYFPETIKDGKVDFDALKEVMGNIKEVKGEEKYELTWAGKQSAKNEYLRDIVGKTLKYKPQDSLNPDTTENLYIEGDNLEVLKLLYKNYRGKIKMIYIDPPYNTGKKNEFIYNDKFKYSKDELTKISGNMNEAGELFQKNPKGSSDFHSKWLNMMYPRLKVARDLLTEDGVIFISIDDNEQENLKKMCDDIFGEDNYAATFIWTKTSTPPALACKCRKTVEYVFAYEKNLNKIKYYGANIDGGDVPLLNTGNPLKTLLFPKGSIHFTFVSNGIVKAGIKGKVEILDDLYIKNGLNDNAVRIIGEFKWEQSTLNKEITSGTYFLVKTDKYSIRFQRKNIDEAFKTPTNFLNIELGKECGVGTNETADKELNKLGLSKYFDYTKPYSLIKTVINMVCKNNLEALVLDFFSGSATTAHAVMQLNAEDGGNRKFIMVQLQEPCGKEDEAYKAGYKNICEIGKERIRRAAKKIHEEQPEAKFDDGFKCFEVADTNIKWIYDETHKTTVTQHMPETESYKNYGEDTAKSEKDRIDFTFGFTDENVVYELMLRQHGIPLSTKIEKLTEISDRTYMFANSYVVCLEDTITDEIVTKLAEIEPVPAVYVLRDTAFGDNIELKDYTYRKLVNLVKSNMTKEEQNNRYNNFKVEFI